MVTINTTLLLSEHAWLGNSRQLDAERARVELDQARAVQRHALSGDPRRLALPQQPLNACAAHPAMQPQLMA